MARMSPRHASFILQFQERVSDGAPRERWASGTTTHTNAREEPDHDAGGTTRTKTETRENDDTDMHRQQRVFGALSGTSTHTKTREDDDTDIGDTSDHVFPAGECGPSVPLAAFGTETITKTREPTDTDIAGNQRRVFGELASGTTTSLPAEQ